MHEIWVFCYGTLKRRQRNCRFCRTAARIEKAVICGKLYQLQAGYPALQVPPESVIRKGSKNITSDALLQCAENRRQCLNFKIDEGWSLVHGELVTFADPKQMLPIDKLEGFSWLYGRDLVPVRCANGRVITAWVYTMDKLPGGAELLPDGEWPK